MATQWAAVIVAANNSGQAVATETKVNMDPLRMVSMATSTLTIVLAIVKFISVKRKRNFAVSRRHPVVACLHGWRRRGPGGVGGLLSHYHVNHGMAEEGARRGRGMLSYCHVKHGMEEEGARRGRWECVFIAT